MVLNGKGKKRIFLITSIHPGQCLSPAVIVREAGCILNSIPIHQRVTEINRTENYAHIHTHAHAHTYTRTHTHTKIGETNLIRVEIWVERENPHSLREKMQTPYWLKSRTFSLQGNSAANCSPPSNIIHLYQFYAIIEGFDILNHFCIYLLYLALKLLKKLN